MINRFSATMRIVLFRAGPWACLLVLVSSLTQAGFGQSCRLVHLSDIKLQTPEPQVLHLFAFDRQSGIWATNQVHNLTRFDTSGRPFETNNLSFLSTDWTVDTLYHFDHYQGIECIKINSYCLSFKDWIVNVHGMNGCSMAGYLLSGRGLYPDPTPVDSSGFYAFLATSTPLVVGNRFYTGIRRSNKRDWPKELPALRDTLLADWADNFATYARFPAIVRYSLELHRDTFPGPERVQQLAYDQLIGRQGEHFQQAYERGYYREPSSQHLNLAWDARRHHILAAPINHHHITAYDTLGNEVRRFGQRGRHLRQPYFEGIPASVFDSLVLAAQSVDSLYRLLGWFQSTSVFLTESYFDLHIDTERGVAYRLYCEPSLHLPIAELIEYTFQGRSKLYNILNKNSRIFLQAYDLESGKLLYDEPTPTPKFNLSFIDPQGTLWAVTAVDETSVTVGRFRLVRQGE